MRWTRFAQVTAEEEDHSENVEISRTEGRSDVDVLDQAKELSAAWAATTGH